MRQHTDRIGRVRYHAEPRIYHMVITWQRDDLNSKTACWNTPVWVSMCYTATSGGINQMTAASDDFNAAVARNAAISSLAVAVPAMRDDTG